MAELVDIKLEPRVFREYDVRGVVGTELNPLTAEVLARGFGTYLLGRSIKEAVVGHDCRPSSYGLAKAVVKGLVDSGLEVTDVEVVPTPVLYFSMFHLGVDGGVMVTGSHNPSNFNGFKLCAGKTAIYGAEIQKVRDLCDRAAFINGQGTLETKDVVQAYIDRVASDARTGDRKLKVVVDAGNGSAGQVALPLFERLGLDVVPLYCEMDGTFPNHHPDPTVLENLRDLRAKVVEEGADLGIAFDGDADRLGVVDERGEVLFGDMVLMILARALLEENPGAAIVAEVKCSQVLFDEIGMMGGRPIMWKVGHSLIKAKMADEGALLAGEMSGHIFYKHRWYGFDDAVYAATRLLEVLSRTDKPLSTLLEGVPRMVATPEIRVDCPDHVKFQVVERMVQHYKERGLDVVDIDGARVSFHKGWGLVRASNTQPVLVYRFEAEDDESLERIRSDMMGLGAKVSVELQ